MWLSKAYLDSVLELRFVEVEATACPSLERFLFGSNLTAIKSDKNRGDDRWSKNWD
jgi:hypothetical protein